MMDIRTYRHVHPVSTSIYVRSGTAEFILSISGCALSARLMCASIILPWPAPPFGESLSISQKLWFKNIIHNGNPSWVSLHYSKNNKKWRCKIIGVNSIFEINTIYMVCCYIYRCTNTMIVFLYVVLTLINLIVSELLLCLTVEKNCKEIFFTVPVNYDRDSMLTLELWSQIFLFWIPLCMPGFEASTKANTLNQAFLTSFTKITRNEIF